MSRAAELSLALLLAGLGGCSEPTAGSESPSAAVTEAALDDVLAEVDRDEG